ncbi:MAG: PAS domain S-box protein [Deltaproteobacteria bacterium]|nr:PAS domain S-box protein [Deltaproteobacteria bacterium]
MAGTHSLLRRQLKRFFGDGKEIPTGFQPFIKAVNDAYCEFDIDREMLERSLELSSQELLQINAEMRAVLQAFPDTLFTIDHEGTIMSCKTGSPGDLLVMPEGKIVGKRIQDIPFSDIGHKFREALQEVNDTQSVVSIEYLLEVRGQPSYYEARLAPLFQDQRIVIVRNITERKQAEEVLRFTQFSVDHAQDGILWTMPDARIFNANEAAFRSLGYSRQELLSMTVLDIDDRHTEATWSEWWMTLKTEGTQITTASFRRKDGSVFPVGVHSNYLIVDGKEYIFAFFRDITEQVQAEEEKEKLQMQLLQSQKMQALGTLAGGIAHDFNNILGAIIGYTELSRFSIREDTPAWENLAKVLQACHRAKDLVARILAFSRQSEQEMKPTQLHLVVNEVLRLLAASLPSSIKIRTSLSADSDIIMADPTQIHQVLMNLCANAHHAMMPEGGELRVELATVQFDADDVAANPDLTTGEYCRLSVRDTGHGMDRRTMEKIFEPYFTTKKKGVGTGMGLSVVHGIVKNHHGAIVVDSGEGKGTTVAVFLPKTEEQILPEIKEPLRLPHGDERIIFIDDEEVLVELGEKALKRLGYSVTGMTCPIEALKAFRAHPAQYDLVITDMTMPNMNGDRLAREMMTIRPDIPIIICTGYSEFISEGKAAVMGVKGFLMKPVAVKDLAETIRTVFDNR